MVFYVMKLAVLMPGKIIRKNVLGAEIGLCQKKRDKFYVLKNVQNHIGVDKRLHLLTGETMNITTIMARLFTVAFVIVAIIFVIAQTILLYQNYIAK